MVIVIGLCCWVLVILLVMDVFFESGVKILYLFDVIMGKLVRCVDWVICCYIDGMMLFDSVVVVLVMVNLICLLMVEKLCERGNGYL